MDRRSGRVQAQPEQAHPVLWSAATVRKRRATGYSTLAYMRRYLGRMVIVLTLVTPLLVVMTYQWAPRRGQRDADELVTIALASAQSQEAGQAARAVGVQPSGGRAPAAGQLDTQRAVVGARPAGKPGAPDVTRPMAWYRTAAAEQRLSPYLLEALHQIESSAATDGCLPNADGSGAVGPFQFKRSTFGQYGVDGNGDGVVDICGFVDSLVSAAVYLRALGADEDLDGPGVRQALERYGTDVDRVIDLARFYRARDASLTAEAAPSN